MVDVHVRAPGPTYAATPWQPALGNQAPELRLIYVLPDQEDVGP